MIKFTRRTALVAGLAVPAIARAQAFPSRPLRLVVPFPPAGAADITARLVAERMGPLLGQTVVIDNRPGAGAISRAKLWRVARQMGIRCSWAGRRSCSRINTSIEMGCLSMAFAISRISPACRWGPRCLL